MPFPLRWHAPQILYYHLQQPFTWDELNQSINQAIEMARSQPNREVGTLLDVAGVNHIPSGAIAHGIEVVKRKPANANYIVVLGAQPFVKGFHGIVRALFPAITRRVAFADDLETGAALLRQMMGEEAPTQSPVIETPEPVTDSAPMVPTNAPIPMPRFDHPETRAVFHTITSDETLLRRWQETIIWGMDDGEILWLAEQFVKALPHGFDLKTIEWTAFITEMFLIPTLPPDTGEMGTANVTPSAGHS